MNTLPKAPRDLLPWIYWVLFFIVVPIVGLWMASKPAPQVNVPVTVRELAPYHIITASDLITKPINAQDVANDAIRDQQNLVGHYTREVVQEEKPIHENQIGVVADARLISNTLAVAIPATSATILGGNLGAGDVVSLATVPISDTSTIPTILFDAVLVLDVKANDKDTVIILAVPTNRWFEFLAKTRNAQVVLARRVE